MSGRRERYRDNSSSPEPIIIERRPAEHNIRSARSPSPPQRRRRQSVRFNLNPFSRGRTVVIKEHTRSRRRQEHRARAPSPSPSPPRGPNHIMDGRIGTDYVPLPKKLPQKDEEDSTSEEERKMKARRRKAQIHYLDPDDRNAYPKVEKIDSPSGPAPRDSGFYSMSGTPGAKVYNELYGRSTYLPSHNDVHELADQFNSILNQKDREKLEAEQAALRAEKKAQAANAELERVKRSSYLDSREREVAEKEQQLYDGPHRSGDKAATRPDRRVVIHQDNPPIVRYDGAVDDPLKRAREDEKRRSGKYAYP